MPTVLGGKGKLSIVCFLLRCASAQVTGSRHNSCAKDVLGDMTQSWPTRQALGGDQAQRFLYHPKDAKQHAALHRQPRGDAHLRVTHHPHVAPHKSMLADDLKLSSDEDDPDRAAQHSASWDRNSRSGQHTHTHGGRVRHSSSDSSGSDSSSESETSTLRSRSPSPETHSDPGSPANTQPLGTKETDRPSTTQWQLDKWLKKVRKKSASSDQDPREHLQRIPGHAPSPDPHRAPSPDPHRAPSPARSWDKDQEYSPSQSPIPSPQFSYSHRNSPLPSPGYSFCPSPSPFPSTCPSPTPSPGLGHSPVPSPVPSVCPSPCGSPRASPSCSPSPIPRHPPKSPSPSLPPSSPPRYPQLQDPRQDSFKPLTRPSLTNSLDRPKITHNHSPQPPPQHRSKTKPTPDKGQSKAKVKDKATPGLNSDQSHNHKSKPDLNFQPNTLTAAPKTKHPSKPERTPKEGRRPGHSADPNLRPTLQPSSRTSPSRTKHLPATAVSQDTSGKTSHTSHTHSTSKATASTTARPSSRSSPGLKPKAKSSEAPAPVRVRIPHPDRPQKKPRSGEPEVDRRETAPTQTAERKSERKEEKRRDKQREKRERKEDRRLAEEQLLRRPWIQSSEEEEGEKGEGEKEEGEKERQRRREDTAREEKRRRRREQHQQQGEWQAVQPKQRPHTNSQRHHAHGDPRRPGRTDKRRRRSEEEERESQPDPSPPPSHSPTLLIPSNSSSSSSSGSDSEPSDHPVNIAKVPADSTSRKRPIPRRGPQGPGRPRDNRPKAVYPRGPASSNPGQGHLSGDKRILYTLVPFGRSEQAAATPQRGLGNLVVQIDLSLLNRVPDTTTGAPQKHSSSSSSSSSLSKAKQREAMRHLFVPDTESRDAKRKRKSENGVSHRESKRSSSHTNDPSGQTETSAHKPAYNITMETIHNGLLEEYLDSKRPLSPLSPLSDTPEPSKPSFKTQCSEQHYSHKDKDRDAAVRPKMEVECLGQSQTGPGSWGPLIRQPGGQKGTMLNHETLHHAEYYMHEAKRMKHRADAMVDKLGKAVNYVDAALSFMECGKAMEEGPVEAKSPYTMYSETVELIRYAMRLKSHSGPGARQEDKQLAVLCFRCLALLYWQMFRLKKDHALKYSKALLDYFKSSPKVPSAAQPFWSDLGKGVAGPPPSLSPSPKSLTQGSHGASAAASSLISIPQRIHQMAANHLNITNSVLYSYEYWEVADNLAKENKEFFNYLNTLSGPLTLHSSVAHAVQYTRQALQWIRISAKLN